MSNVPLRDSDYSHGPKSTDNDSLYYGSTSITPTLYLSVRNQVTRESQLDKQRFDRRQRLETGSTPYGKTYGRAGSLDVLRSNERYAANTSRAMRPATATGAAEPLENVGRPSVDLLESELGRNLTLNESNNVITLASHEARAKSLELSRSSSKYSKSSRSVQRTNTIRSNDFRTADVSSLNSGRTGKMPVPSSGTLWRKKTPASNASRDARSETTSISIKRQAAVWRGDDVSSSLRGNKRALGAEDANMHPFLHERDSSPSDDAHTLDTNPIRSITANTIRSGLRSPVLESSTTIQPSLPLGGNSLGLRRDSDTLPSTPASPVVSRNYDSISAPTASAQPTKKDHASQPASRVAPQSAVTTTTPLVSSAEPVPRTSEKSGRRPVKPIAIPRDIYGFKKEGQHVTAVQYDAWNSAYVAHVERRRKKWLALMKQHKLSTDNPTEFPSKSDKVKRYVRKGIPPEWRGAAWFWYAGGPAIVSRHKGLYEKLLHKASTGQVKLHDQENIDRDLYRTFPDHVLFKPDPPNAGSDIDYGREETPMIRSLLRVLQAFAIHKPEVGYCQSLNFLAAQLLVFLHGNEEKAFHMLNVITQTYFPGTHGASLEGANTDIGVFMDLLQESMPAVWRKLDDRPQGSLKSTMPTASLATTAWFMSALLNTLPPESVARVWDCMFYDGSKAVFQAALAIVRIGEPKLLRARDPMEAFQVLQTLPKGLLDANALMDVSTRKNRGGFGRISQDLIDNRRREKGRLNAFAKNCTPPLDDRAGTGQRASKIKLSFFKLKKL